MKDVSKKLFLEELYKNSVFTLQKIQQKQFDLKISLSQIDIADGKFSDFLSDTTLTQTFLNLYNDATLPSLSLEVLFPLSNEKIGTPNGRMIICISKDYDGVTSPYYIRNGLVISHANQRKLSRGLSALVFIPAMDETENNINELSNFLNSCENPAHTSWSTSGDQFKKSKYNINRTYSEGVVRTVKQFVFQIEKLVSSDNNVVLKKYFTEVFNTSNNKPGSNKTGGKGGTSVGTGGKLPSLDSSFIYDEESNTYTLTIISSDKVNTATFNYLTRDYSKSVYRDSQFTLTQSTPSKKELGLITSNINITRTLDNEIKFELIGESNGSIVIKNANKFKMLGVELIK